MASRKRTKVGVATERRSNALVATFKPDFAGNYTSPVSLSELYGTAGEPGPHFANFFTPPMAGEDLRRDASGKGPDFDSFFAPPMTMDQLQAAGDAAAPKNALAAKAVADWEKTAKSSEPFVNGEKIYPEPPAGIKQGDFDWFAHNASLQGPDMTARVMALAAKAKAEGRTEPNLYEMLEMGAMVPPAMLQGAINAAASALTLPGDAASGKQPVMDPRTGMADPEAVARALDLTGLMSGGSFAGAPKGALGSGPVRIKSAAVKYDGKIYEGRDHMEAADAAAVANKIDENDIYDLLEGDGGFITDDGRYVERDEASRIAKAAGQLDETGVEGSPWTRAEDMDLNAGGKGLAPLLAADFSHAARVVEGLPTVRASADQWLATLKNKGVKDEELEWLKLPTGPQVLTKDEITAAIKAGTPVLEDVVKGDKVESGWSDAEDERYNELTDKGYDGKRTAAEDAEFLRLQERFDAVSDDYGNSNVVTKYSQYQLPGGEDYREILVTTPSSVVGSLVAKQRKSGRWSPHTGKFFIGPEQGFLTEAEALSWAKSNAYDGTKDYHSSHWDEPNVLGHMRVNDRKIDAPPPATIGAIEAKLAKGLDINPAYLGSGAPDLAVAKGIVTPDEASLWSKANHMDNKWAKDTALANPDGLKTLHAEELQSDWHQQGKKQGYKGIGDVSDYEATLEPAGWQIKDKSGKDVGVVPKTDQIRGLPANQVSADEAIKAWLDAGAVPDAPFKKSWPDLLLKRLVKRAIDEGYDAISWTDGATQAERYDLSKSVDRVVYSVNDQALRAYQNGQLVISKQNVPPDALENYIGKDAADAIVNRPTAKTIDGNELTGAGLKTEGAGMKAFYDQELPRRAKKLLGTPVEKKPLLSVDQNTVLHEAMVIARQYGDIDWNALGPDSRARYIKDAKESLGTVSGNTVHFVRLTPEVKARVAKGFPLFSSGAPILSDDGQYKLVPIDHDPFQGE